MDGILRLHLGRGSFRLDRREDQILMMGGPKDAFYAYESLRLLGGLAQVNDLHRWKFARPGRLISQRGGEGGQVLSDDELMGWFYQQRFDRFIAARKTDPKRSAPSLQTP